MRRTAFVESQPRPSALTLELARKTERVKELQSQLDRLRGVAEEKRTLEREIAALQQEFDQYKATVGALEGERHVRLHQTCAALVEERDETARALEKEKAEKALICEEAEAKIRQQNSEIYDQDCQIEKYRRSLHAAQSEIAQLKTAVAQQARARQETKSRCIRSLARARKQVIELREELKSVKRDSQQLQELQEQVPVQRVALACRQAVASMERRLREEVERRDRAETALRVVMASRRRRAPAHRVESGLWMSGH